MSQWRISGFDEVRELGSGAQGRVVLARHARTGSPVAIKYVHRRPGDEAAIERLRAEAVVLGRITDPHVSRLYRFVSGEHGAAIVMEAVNGVSLKAILAEHGELAPEAALVVLKGSLLGLKAAHALGVVHRDYKPANVVVQEDGLSKLIDFGVATVTGDGSRTGTPAYMSPSSGRGVPRRRPPTCTRPPACSSSASPGAARSRRPTCPRSGGGTSANPFRRANSPNRCVPSSRRAWPRTRATVRRPPTPSSRRWRPSRPTRTATTGSIAACGCWRRARRASRRCSPSAASSPRGSRAGTPSRRRAGCWPPPEPRSPQRPSARRSWPGPGRPGPTPSSGRRRDRRASPAPPGRPSPSRRGPAGSTRRGRRRRPGSGCRRRYGFRRARASTRCRSGRSGSSGPPGGSAPPGRKRSRHRGGRGRDGAALPERLRMRLLPPRRRSGPPQAHRPPELRRRHTDLRAGGRPDRQAGPPRLPDDRRRVPRRPRGVAGHAHPLAFRALRSRTAHHLRPAPQRREHLRRRADVPPGRAHASPRRHPAGTGPGGPADRPLRRRAPALENGTRSQEAVRERCRRGDGCQWGGGRKPVDWR
ncbi:protein kinase [Actinomadura sp. J1-007]|nr:protein kinase [Actinomadura sp. J1-007]